jgi:hypothetical protein
MISVLFRPYFHNDEMAFADLESVLLIDGAKFPHCGSLGKHYDLRKIRVGLRKCQDCRKQFTVKVGTVCESAHQLHRIIGITYKSIWFLTQRIHEAMRSGDLSRTDGPNSYGIIDADETYYGDKDVFTKRTKRDTYQHCGEKHLYR